MRGRVVVGRGCRHSHGVGRQISGCRVDGVLGRGWEARGVAFIGGLRGFGQA